MQINASKTPIRNVELVKYLHVNEVSLSICIIREKRALVHNKSDGIRLLNLRQYNELTSNNGKC